MKAQRKAIAAARLAADRAAVDDGQAECTTAAAIAGRLAFEANMTLADLAAAVPQLMFAANYLAWAVVVDAWYDAYEAELTPACRETCRAGHVCGLEVK